VKKKVFISGAGGYIGGHLAQYLREFYTVLAPTHKELDLLSGPSVERFLRKYRPYAVIHCAIVGGSRAEEHTENSLALTLRMFYNLERCKKYYTKFIHLGSGAEYDKSRQIKKIKESEFGEFIPSDSYGFTKYIIGQHIEHSSDKFVNLRLFGIFGYGEDYRLRFISNTLVRRLLKKDLIIRQNAVFDYIYIKDFLKVVAYFIKHTGKYRSYNIGTGKKLALLEIAQHICHMTDSHEKIRILKKGLNREYTCDNTRLMKELGNFHFLPFDTALRELYDLYVLNKKSLIL
jgi:GDP-L-fucose synthase